jgi:general L-amino acid transport system permease protein
MSAGRPARLRARFFHGPAATLVTLGFAALLAWALWHAVDWGVLRAVTAPDAAACKAPARGACWGFVAEKWRLILFGRYPYEAQWRPAVATLAVVAMLLVSAWPRFWSRRGAVLLGLGWALAFAVFFVLMLGGAFGLAPVGTERWGGLPLTVILTLIGMAASTPLGVLLALGRRAEMPLVRTLCTAYIELVRGVPFLTVLFVATFVFPLVLPPGWRIDPFWRSASSSAWCCSRAPTWPIPCAAACRPCRAASARPASRSASATGSCSARSCCRRRWWR